VSEGDDRLPSTDDPHELLGIPEDADERTIRRAYAQRIKRWRPDRSPDEFRRVHRAYELAMGSTVRAEAPVARTTAEHAERARAEPEHVDVERRAAAAAEALRVARAASDYVLVDQVLARAVADGVPIGAIFEYSSDELHVTMANSPALTWSRISANGGRGYAAETLRSVLGVSVGMQFQTRAYALLSDPALVRAVADDPRLASICLRAIATLAWVNLPPAPANARSWYRVLPEDAELAALARRVDLDLAAGARCLVPGLGLPAPLIECFAYSSMLPAPMHRHLLDNLADDLRTHPADYLDAFDRVPLVMELETFLLARIEAETPGGAEHVTPDDALAGMARRLRAGGGRLATRVAVGAFGAACLAAMALPPISAPQLIPVPVIAGGIVLALLESGRYQDVRRDLAAVIAEAGVQASDVARWLADAGTRRCPRWGRFSARVARDPGLLMLGRLAVMVSTHARRG